MSTRTNTRRSKKAKQGPKYHLPMIEEESTDINSEGTVVSNTNAEGSSLNFVNDVDVYEIDTLFDEQNTLIASINTKNMMNNQKSVKPM